MIDLATLSRRCAAFAFLLLACPPLASAANDISINFAGAAPRSYDHQVGGGAWGQGSSSEVVASLQGGDFRCGDAVSYLVRIDVAGSPRYPVTAVRLTFRLSADSTGRSGAAHVAVPRTFVNYGDPAIRDDRGSQAVLHSAVFVPATGPYVSGTDLVAVVDVSDLEASEVVIVRIDGEIGCKPRTDPTGNLQASLSSIEITSPVSQTLNGGGAQTIPFQQIGDIAGTGEPLVSMSGSAEFPTGTCPGSPLLAVAPGGAYVSCTTLVNTGTAPLLNVLVVDDGGTAASADDALLTFQGLADEDGDGSADDLAPGATAVGSATRTAPMVDGTFSSTLRLSGDGGTTEVTLETTYQIEVGSWLQSRSDAGGLESNGRLAAALSRRAVREAWKDVSGKRIRTESLETSDPDLLALVPPVGPGGSRPVLSTPADLPEVTNARHTLGVDYVAADGHRVASLLLIETVGAIYEHSKILCDRAKGARLERLALAPVPGGGGVLRVTLRNERDGTIDHAAWLKLYDRSTGRSPLAVSRWAPAQYPEVFAGERVINIETWSIERGEEIALIEQVLELTPGSASPQWAEPPVLPAAYFAMGRTLGSRVETEVEPSFGAPVNIRYRAVGEGGSVLVGDFGDVAPGLRRVALERAFAPFLDVTLEMIGPKGELIDSLWLSDGSWTHLDDGLFGGQTKIASFWTRRCPLFEPKAAASTLRLSGCAGVIAEVSQYAGVARYIGGAFSPLDLSGFSEVSFWMRSDAPVDVCIHGLSGAAGRAPCVAVPPVAGAWVRIPLSSFMTREAGGAHVRRAGLLTFMTSGRRSASLEVSSLTFAVSARRRAVAP